MHHELLRSGEAIYRYVRAPLFEEREAYLQHCAKQGCTKRTLISYRFTMLSVVEELPHLAKGVSRTEILEAAIQWKQKRNKPAQRKSCRLFVTVAVGLSKSMGCLRPSVERAPFEHQIDEFAKWLRDERGLSEQTIGTYCWYSRSFLQWCLIEQCSLEKIRIEDVDRFLAGQSWSRITLKGCGYSLRAFLRLAHERGWCEQSVAEIIATPRVYAMEAIPDGLTWNAIGRVIMSLETHKARDIRDKAIILLCSVYGLRVTEIAGLKLEDIDWEHNQIRVWRSKSRRIQTYPLTKQVGGALVRYLVAVRPKSPIRQLFLTVATPITAITSRGISKCVRKRLANIGINSSAHKLRHACATRLVTQGLSFKEIADHLGHRSLSHTAVYAKVNLAGLRQVALIDLGGVI